MLDSEPSAAAGTFKRAGFPPVNPRMVSVAGLMARGWTPLMIASMLGDPEKYAPNPHCHNGPMMRLYTFERVKAVEASAEFLAIKTRKEKRTAIAKTAKPLDLTTGNILAAISAVSKGAARRQGAAETTHRPGNRRFAAVHDQKKRLYEDLKDRGIAYLVQQGDLADADQAAVRQEAKAMRIVDAKLILERLTDYRDTFRRLGSS
jgi:hypothetical protein